MKGYKFSKSEHGIQSAGFNWVRRNRANPNPLISHAMELCHAIPNGLSTNESQKAKMEGLTAGIPDIHLPWPIVKEISDHSHERLAQETLTFAHGPRIMKIIPGLYIEMKYGRNTLSPGQKDIRDLLVPLGFRYRVCYSTKEMIQSIMDYLPFNEDQYFPPEYL